MSWLTEPFSLPFMQRALLEVVLLAVVSGLLGTWIVLRRQAFFTHALGSATFPGLVVAARFGLPPQLAGLLAASCFAGSHEALKRGKNVAQGEATGVLLVAALSVGTVLASDLYRSPGSVDQMLFGTLLGVTTGDIAASAVVAFLALLATLVLGRSWTATTFDSTTGTTFSSHTTVAKLVMSGLIGAAVVVTLGAVGALLTGALLVVPAATARLVVSRLPLLYPATMVAALLEGVAGLWLAYRLDIPPGPAVAVIASTLFIATLIVTRIGHSISTGTARTRLHPQESP